MNIRVKAWRQPSTIRLVSRSGWRRQSDSHWRVWPIREVIHFRVSVVGCESVSAITCLELPNKRINGIRDGLCLDWRWPLVGGAGRLQPGHGAVAKGGRKEKRRSEWPNNERRTLRVTDLQGDWTAAVESSCSRDSCGAWRRSHGSH